MKKKTVLLGAAGAATAAVILGTIGVVSAGQFANVSASNYLVGQNTLEATCANAATAVVHGSPNVDYANNAFPVASAEVTITDPVNGAASIGCSGKTLTVIATGAAGVELARGTYVIPANGDVAATITFTPEVDGEALQGFAAIVK